ncbi:MAG TPA: ATP-binding protein [Rhodocyclaceae bacterium]|nr:ATP-binding protein [Rhodocyclaceae bacterium]
MNDRAGEQGVEARITESDLLQRKAYLGLSEEDAARLRALAGPAAADREAFLEGFYRHMAEFADTAAALERSRIPVADLRRLHGGQIDSLLGGTYDLEFAAERGRVGESHHRAGLAPEWTIGAYSRYLGWLLPLAARQAGDDREGFLATVMALVKVVLLDVELAIGAYFRADHERLRLLAKVFESDLEAVLIVDPAGTIAEANHMTLAYSGYRPEELVGRRLDSLYSRRNKGAFADIWRNAVAGGTWHGDVWHRHAGGHDYLARMSIAAVGGEAGVAEHYVVEYADATEEWEAEQALKTRTEELHRSNQELEQFAYVASHDLQEPLRMVASYTQLLARRYKGKLDQDADEFIAFASDGATRMQGLINDLLKYSRVGTRGHAFAPVAGDKLLLDAMSNLEMAIHDSGALIGHDPLPTLVGDATQLTQLLQNLIGNAVKFRQPGEVPRIHVGARRLDDGWELSVQDNGIGISPEYFERIFVIFQRLHSKQDYPGTGIGLAVCKKIVERHGGRIWVESRPGAGAKFLFTIPDREENPNGQ